MSNEDLGTPVETIEKVTTPIVEETTPIVEETTPIVEETTPTIEETTVPVLTPEEIDNLLSDILKDEEPVEPVFPKEEEKEEKEEEDVEEITEDDLEQIDSLLEDYETKFETLKSEIETLNLDIETKDKTITELNKLNSKFEDGINKISSHPIIGPLALKIYKGEKVDIPEYLQKSIDNDLDAIPNMGDIQNVSIPEKPKITGEQSIRARVKQGRYRSIN